MLQVLEDPIGRGDDLREAQQAAQTLARIDAELSQIANGARGRAAAATRTGQEIAAGFGLTALASQRAQQMQRIGMIRFALKNLPIDRLRLGQPPGLMMLQTNL